MKKNLEFNKLAKFCLESAAVEEWSAGRWGEDERRLLLEDTDGSVGFAVLIGVDAVISQILKELSVGIGDGDWLTAGRLELGLEDGHCNWGSSNAN